MAYELNLFLPPQDIEVKIENSFEIPLDLCWTTSAHRCVEAAMCNLRL